GVRGADPRVAGALLLRIAFAGGRATHVAVVPGGMLAQHRRAVALIHGAQVAIVGAARAVRLLGVRGAGGARPGTGVGEVALARGDPAHRARVTRRMDADLVGRAARADIRRAGVAVVALVVVAALVGVREARARREPRRLPDRGHLELGADAVLDTDRPGGVDDAVRIRRLLPRRLLPAGDRRPVAVQHVQLDGFGRKEAPGRDVGHPAGRVVVGVRPDPDRVEQAGTREVGALPIAPETD